MPGGAMTFEIRLFSVPLIDVQRLAGMIGWLVGQARRGRRGRLIDHLAGTAPAEVLVVEAEAKVRSSVGSAFSCKRNE
jgi:hypothetical protein